MTCGAIPKRIKQKISRIRSKSRSRSKSPDDASSDAPSDKETATPRSPSPATRQNTIDSEISGRSLSNINIALDEHMQADCVRVAKALKNGDVFLVCAGTGFQADSGLPLHKEFSEVPQYRSRGLSYAGLCEPSWLENDLSLFYGFWGTMFNDFRLMRPHPGYNILASWRDQLFDGTAVAESLRQRQQQAAGESVPEGEQRAAGAFFVYTSNIDTYAFDFFRPAEIRECQGNTEGWQCGSACSKRLWRAPRDYIFRVDLRNMLASDPPGTNMDSGAEGLGTRPEADQQQGPPHGHREERKLGKRRSEGRRRSMISLPGLQEDKLREMFGRPNRPICPLCKSPARPNVLMFSDLAWIDNEAQERRWNAWCKALKEESQSRRNGTPLNVVIMEIGAGVTTLPMVRSTSQNFAGRLEQVGANVTLVRINPNNCIRDGVTRLKHFIGLPLKGLPALHKVDLELQALIAKATGKPNIETRAV